MSTMAVGSNLAAAFTLFGTLAIVRFRTAHQGPPRRRLRHLLRRSSASPSAMQSLARRHRRHLGHRRPHPRPAGLFNRTRAARDIRSTRQAHRSGASGLPDAAWRSALDDGGHQRSASNPAPIDATSRATQAIKIRASRGIAGRTLARRSSPRLLAIPARPACGRPNRRRPDHAEIPSGRPGLRRIAPPGTARRHRAGDAPGDSVEPLASIRRIDESRRARRRSTRNERVIDSGLLTRRAAFARLDGLRQRRSSRSLIGRGSTSIGGSDRRPRSRPRARRSRARGRACDCDAARPRSRDSGEPAASC